MKIAVVGNGNVGMAVFGELRTLAGVDEVVLVGRNQERLRAEVVDYLDAKALYDDHTAELSYGSFAACEGADIIVYTSGAKRAEGESRTQLLQKNVKITREVFTQINQYNEDAIVIVIANPVDILTYTIAGLRKSGAEKVIGTGTLLDTARLKRILGGICEISPDSISGYVIGEHGDSQVIAWSSLKIAGLSVNEYNQNIYHEKIDIREEVMKNLVKSVGGKLIKGKGYTSYGVALATRRIISAIIHDRKEILPVSTVLLDDYEISDCAISVPCIIGKGGIIRPIHMNLDDQESLQFMQSVQNIQGYCLEADRELTIKEKIDAKLRRVIRSVQIH